MITNKNYNVDLAKLWDKKLMYGFAKEMQLDTRDVGNESTRNRSLKSLFKLPSILVSASGVPSSHKTSFLPSDPNELCNRLNLLLLEKQAGKTSDKIDEKIVAMVDELSKY